MLEETFFLHPPEWLDQPPRPKSTALFRHYVKTAPDLWPRNTSTYQGFYLMSPKGDHLAGSFGITREKEANEMMTAALKTWQATEAAMTPVPDSPIALYGGKEPSPGGVKWQLAYRDLPRGEIERPSSADVQNPYNLGWYDLSATEAQAFLTDAEDPQPVKESIFRKLAVKVLKDAVQGQMSGWEESAMRRGTLQTQLVSQRDGTITCRLTGSVDLQEGSRRYTAQLHGRVVFEEAAKRFVAFDLVAAGQRTGKGPANGRETDLGPAPMGVAMTLFDLP